MPSFDTCMPRELIDMAELDVGRLFDEHAAFLLRVTERLTGSRDAAEDIVQRVFLIAHQNRDRLVDDGQIRGWLYRVAQGRVQHHRRSIARRLGLLDRLRTQDVQPEPSRPDEDLARAQQAQRVRACTAKLPLPQREVFVLREFEELSGSEMAALLEISENVVWSRLRLARARFKRLWSQQEKKGG